ncbi:unnamed protein product [Linum tenue]|uniref:RNA-binding protein 48 n=1 Tax=Linum tenue TaxID=586396 RepID=A0AAV0HM02_9ROSI|nr:unnamed protein product [Linum tenue]
MAFRCRCGLFRLPPPPLSFSTNQNQKNKIRERNRLLGLGNQRIQPAMPRHKDELPAVRVYTVCDESRYLIVRNVPALGCGDDLQKLFASYGDVEEFAKRKLDEHVFLGNKLQVSYAPQFESLSDTKDKLQGRTNQVLARLNRAGKSPIQPPHFSSHPQSNSNRSRDVRELEGFPRANDPPLKRVSSDQDYFPSQSMNETVNLVRKKLDKIQSSSDQQAGTAPKKLRVDNRRRI